MSDSPIVSALTRKLERERRAREAAEKQLEQYSRDIYFANKQLQDALSSSERSQKELAFLNEMANEVASDISLQDLIAVSMELICDFLGTPFCLQVNQIDSETKLDHIYGRLPNSHISKQQVVVDAMIDTLVLDIGSDEGSWSIKAFNLEGLQDVHWLVCTDIGISQRQTCWIAFFFTEELIDEQYLFVLDTARRHIQTGVTRRLNEARVLRRNKTLLETIESLESTRRQLIQSEKMASLGQLAAGIAHEINNPIGFVHSNLQTFDEYLAALQEFHAKVESHLLVKNLKIDEYKELVQYFDLEFILQDTAELIKSNLDGVERVADIVSGLRTFSHAGSGRTFESVALPDVIDSALKIVWNSLKYHHTVRNEIKSELPLIQGDKGQLQQVFVNLFVNAAQAMPTGGELTLFSTVANDSVTIGVRDTGQGMDEDTQAKLFTPFFTSKPVGEGTGLGLSVSYAILETHNARINVDSCVGDGSCFYLTFPLNDK